MVDLKDQLRNPNYANSSSFARAYMTEAADRIDALEARLAETTKELSLVRAERDRAQKACEQIAARTGAVKVKALEWCDADEGMCTKWRAAALGGHYELVALEKEPGFAVNFHWGRPLSFWFIQGEPDEWGPTGPKMFRTLEAAKAAAQADYERRILSALEPAATCNESLQVEPAAPEGQQPVADALELSGNTGELIDRMAAAIRDWGSHYDDGPWETLPEDRKAGWRGDAERALAVVKEYLTTHRPSEQAVTEAMVEAAADEIVDVAEIDFNGTILPSGSRPRRPPRPEGEATMKLTKQQLHSLMHLAGSDRPVDWRGNNKAMGHKLMKMGFAKYSDGYPIGFVITDAGRAALQEVHE